MYAKFTKINKQAMNAPQTKVETADFMPDREPAKVQDDLPF